MSRSAGPFPPAAGLHAAHQEWYAGARPLARDHAPPRVRSPRAPNSHSVARTTHRTVDCTATRPVARRYGQVHDCVYNRTYTRMYERTYTRPYVRTSERTLTCTFECTPPKPCSRTLQHTILGFTPVSCTRLAACVACRASVIHRVGCAAPFHTGTSEPHRRTVPAGRSRRTRQFYLQMRG